MWTDRQFWKDSTWRAFRTFLQTLSGLLVMGQFSSAFNAPWMDMIGAGLIAAFISLAQSIDRGRATAAVETTPEPAAVQPAVVEPDALSPVVTGCGDQLR